MKLVAYLLVLLANALGGISYLWTKLTLEALPDSYSTINFGRALVGVLCAWLFLRIRPRPRPRYCRRDLFRIAIVGVVGCAAPLYLGTLGIQWSTTGNAAILILVEPAAILLFSWLLLRDSLRWPQVVGIAVIAGGAICVITGREQLGSFFHREYVLGNIVLVLHAVLWGLYTPVLKPIAARYDSMDLTLRVLLMSLVALAPGAIWELDCWATAPSPWTAVGWIALLGVLLSFASTLIWNFALVYLPAPAVAPFIFVQPLAGVLAGVLILNEPLDPSVLAGGSLILAGVIPVLFADRLLALLRRAHSTTAPVP